MKSYSLDISIDKPLW